jgi:predicted RNase H-like HicB family nuclease
MSATFAEIESAKAAIQALNQQWELRFENHDLAGLAALFTEDCVRMPQGGPATVGRSALEAAYRQDLPGCVATGKTGEETERNMHEAVQKHIQGMLEDKLPIPESVALAEYIAVAA